MDDDNKQKPPVDMIYTFAVLYKFATKNGAWYKKTIQALNNSDINSLTGKDICFYKYQYAFNKLHPLYLGLFVPKWYKEIVSKLQEELNNYTIDIKYEVPLVYIKGDKDNWGGYIHPYFIKPNEESEPANSYFTLFMIDRDKFETVNAKYYTFLCIGMLLRLLSLTESTDVAQLTKLYENANNGRGNVIHKYFTSRNTEISSGHKFYRSDIPKHTVSNAIKVLNNVDLIDNFNYEEDDKEYFFKRLNMNSTNNSHFIDRLLECLDQK